MNKLDQYLEALVLDYAKGLNLPVDLRHQMAREISICAQRGYNTRAELISLVKKASVAA